LAVLRVVVYAGLGTSRDDGCLREIDGPRWPLGSGLRGVDVA
jgi:hypothetical protein